VTPSNAIGPQARIGHVHLKLADLERALSFCCGVLGFELMQRIKFSEHTADASFFIG
jgi:catechol 2,3-dioxygenase